MLADSVPMQSLDDNLRRPSKDWHGALGARIGGAKPHCAVQHCAVCGALRRAALRRRGRKLVVRLTFASRSAGGRQLRGRAARPPRRPHDRYLTAHLTVRPPRPARSCVCTSHHCVFCRSNTTERS